MTDSPCQSSRFLLVNGTKPPADLPATCTPAAQEFFRLCLTRDPATRPSAKDLLTHSFLLSWIRWYLSTFPSWSIILFELCLGITCIVLYILSFLSLSLFSCIFFCCVLMISIKMSLTDHSSVWCCCCYYWSIRIEDKYQVVQSVPFELTHRHRKGNEMNFSDQ